MRDSSKAARDNRANQLNPVHPAYYRSRGETVEEAERMARSSRPAVDNRANQLNPNNAAYAGSQGESTAESRSTNASPANRK